MAILNKFWQMSPKAKLVWILGTIFVVSLVLQVAFFSFSLPFGSVEVGTLQEWESPFGKFSIAYPQNWITRELTQGQDGNIAMIMPRNNNFPQVLISRSNFPTQDIEDVVLWGEENNHQLDRQFTSIKLESITMSSVPEKLREYIFFFVTPLETVKMRCFDLYALNHELGYQFAFCAEESDWATVSPVFQKMNESVEFSPE